MPKPQAGATARPAETNPYPKVDCQAENDRGVLAADAESA